MGETVIFPLQMFGFLKIINCSRAQEKVLQKLGKTVETKDERFEQSASNFHQQQAEGHKLYKDLKNFLSAVKVMHESSKRVSETLQEIYSSKWDGHEELKAIVANNDLLWEDYEEKLADQALRTMENYVAQFSEIKVISLQHQGGIMGGPCKLEDKEDPLEKRMAVHSSIAWRISWTEEPGRFRSRESQSWT